MAGTLSEVIEQPLEPDEIAVLRSAWADREGDALVGMPAGQIEVWSKALLAEAAGREFRAERPLHDEIEASRRLQAKGLGELIADPGANDGYVFRANSAGLLRGSTEWEAYLDAHT